MEMKGLRTWKSLLQTQAAINPCLEMKRRYDEKLVLLSDTAKGQLKDVI